MLAVNFYGSISITIQIGCWIYANIAGPTGALLSASGSYQFWPGYRVYYGMDGDQIVILLGGGTKQRQQNDIGRAVERWKDYKRRRSAEKQQGMKRQQGEE